MILDKMDYRQKGMEYIQQNNIKECPTTVEKLINTLQRR